MVVCLVCSHDTEEVNNSNNSQHTSVGAKLNRMRHGEHYEENGKEYMDDHINGVDWHIPDRSEPIINDDGSWNDGYDEKYSWEE